MISRLAAICARGFARRAPILPLSNSTLAFRLTVAVQRDPAQYNLGTQMGWEGQSVALSGQNHQGNIRVESIG